MTTFGSLFQQRFDARAERESRGDHPPDPRRLPRLGVLAGAVGDWFVIETYVGGDVPGVVVRNQHTGDLYWHDIALGSRATTHAITEVCCLTGDVTGVGIELQICERRPGARRFDAHPPRRKRR